MASPVVMRAVRLSPLLLLLLLVLLLVAGTGMYSPVGVYAQQDQPLSGNRLSMDPLGASSPEMLVERFNVVELANGTQTFEPIIVYVSAFVERLFDVNVDRYTHDTSIRLMMSWNDTTFEQLVANATGRSLQPLGLECQRYCSQLSLECCDEVFLPSVQLANVDELTEGRVHTENFIELTDDTGNKTGAIIWISDIHGVYHSNFNFDKTDRRTSTCMNRIPNTPLYKFPNDRQKLEIVASAETCGYIFKESATGKGFSFRGYPPDRSGALGDDTSGWEIEDVSVDIWYAPYTNIYVRSRSNDPNDPFFGPTGFLVPRSQKQLEAEYEACEQNYLELCDSFCSHGFTMTITVKRYNTYFGWNTIFPVVVIVICSLLTYLIDPKQIELRLSSIIALILALTALQFVIQEFLPDSSYLTPVAEMIVAGYWIMLVEALETVTVFWIIEYKATYMAHMQEKKLEESRSMRLTGEQADMLDAHLRHRRPSLERDGSAPAGKNFAGFDVGATTLGRTHSSPISRTDVEKTFAEGGIDVEGDTGPDESGAHSSTTSRVIRALTKMTKHRSAFMASKTEYKTALLIDMVFLLLSSIAFIVSTILFFVLNE